VSILTERVVKSLLDEDRRGKRFCMPHPSATSFVIYGPPGSGKTYFVGQLAEALGWPLVSLNPGHFIEDGLELIEAKSAEIFRSLNNLFHAVVFFDECDELFRDRDDGVAGSRNILSFVTACMLPKLQQLHDQHQILFVLGTNYLSRIDAAIRRPGRFDDLLLFDRPDEKARELHITKVLTRRKIKAEPSLVKKLSDKSCGGMVQEIISIAEQYPSDSVPSIEDYVDWCQRSGEAELDASRLTLSQKDRIKKERWVRMPGFKFK